MTDIRAIAQSYIAEGWSVIPIASGKKAATGKWNGTVYAAAHFNDGDGIAGKCGQASGDRVCVDCDDRTAVTAASRLLPQTLIEGRQGNPDSHHWFIASGAKHASYKHLKDDQNRERTIIELLATGQYAMLPPSVHPSGEVRTWSGQRPLCLVQMGAGSENAEPMSTRRGANAAYRPTGSSPTQTAGASSSSHHTVDHNSGQR